MTEREIRDKLRNLCSQLDEKARVALRKGARCVVAPAFLAASMALTDGCSAPVYGAPRAYDIQVDAGSADSGAEVPPPVDEYGAQFPDAGPAD